MRWFVVVALALVLSACSQSDEDPGVASAGGAETGTETSVTPDAQAFTECMRDNGVDMADPDPDTGQPEFDPEVVGTEAFQTAMDACQELMPAGVREPADPGELDQYQAFAECMRENGLPDFPDPQPGGEGGLFPNSGADRNSPEFQQATEACGHLLTGE
jgi:hypothetical protein